MLSKFYSIYDSKAAAFSPPFNAPSHGVAIRNITSSMDDPKSSLRRFSADYALMYLGDFDDVTGTLTPAPAPVNLGICTEFLPKEV